MLMWAPVVYHNNRNQRCFETFIMDWLCRGAQYFDRCHRKRCCKHKHYFEKLEGVVE